MKFAISLLLALAAAGVVAAGAGANGDPASDVLPFSNVFLSIQDPRSSPAGRDLLAQTQAAATIASISAETMAALKRWLNSIMAATFGGGRSWP